MLYTRSSDAAKLFINLTQIPFHTITAHTTLVHTIFTQQFDQLLDIIRVPPSNAAMFVYMDRVLVSPLFAMAGEMGQAASEVHAVKRSVFILRPFLCALVR